MIDEGQDIEKAVSRAKARTCRTLLHAHGSPDRAP